VGFGLSPRTPQICCSEFDEVEPVSQTSRDVEALIATDWLQETVEDRRPDAASCSQKRQRNVSGPALVETHSLLARESHEESELSMDKNDEVSPTKPQTHPLLDSGSPIRPAAARPTQPTAADSATPPQTSSSPSPSTTGATLSQSLEEYELSMDAYDDFLPTKPPDSFHGELPRFLVPLVNHMHQEQMPLQQQPQVHGGNSHFGVFVSTLDSRLLNPGCEPLDQPSEPPPVRRGQSSKPPLVPTQSPEPVQKILMTRQAIEPLGVDLARPACADDDFPGPPCLSRQQSVLGRRNDLPSSDVVETPALVLQWREWVQSSKKETLEAAQTPGTFNGYFTAAYRCYSAGHNGHDQMVLFCSRLRFYAPSQGMRHEGCETNPASFRSLLCIDIIAREGERVSRLVETLDALERLGSASGITLFYTSEPGFGSSSNYFSLGIGGWICRLEHTIEAHRNQSTPATGERI